MARHVAAPLAASLLLLLAALVAGRITHRSIAHDSRQLIIVEMPFGFGPEGRVAVELRHTQVFFPYGNDPHVDSSVLNRLGLFIAFAQEETVQSEEYQRPGEAECQLDREDSWPVARFDDAAIRNQINHNGTGGGAGEGPAFKTELSPPAPGQYALYFANCAVESGLQVSFKIRIEEYNMGAAGAKDYLSVGETELPTVYMVMFLVFSLMAGAWGYLCWKERHNVHNIHYLMMVLIVFRALTYLAEAGMQHYLRVTGDPSGWNIAFYIFTFFRGIMFFTVLVLIGTGWSYVKPFVGEKEKKILVVVIPLQTSGQGWNIAFYIFTFFRGIMFFTVLVLIGTGWSYVKPFVGEKEKKILVVVIPLQVFANIAIIFLDEASPVRVSWFEWKDMFHLVDIMCCCAILFPIVWSIKHLREGAETDGKAAVNVEKLTLFRQFYVMVVVYIYFTRIIVYLLQNTLPFEHHWMSNAAKEIATLTFYLLVGMKFRPHSENKYFKLASDAAV